MTLEVIGEKLNVLRRSIRRWQKTLAENPSDASLLDKLARYAQRVDQLRLARALYNAIRFHCKHNGDVAFGHPEEDGRTAYDVSF